MKMVIMMEKNIMKKTIVSGIGPGSGGVGNYITYISQHFPNINLIFPGRSNSKISFINKVFNFFTIQFLFIKVLFVRKHHVLIFSQQYLKLSLIKYLVKNNRTTFYLMDNSFFCVKSYNYLESKKGECFECLGGKWENIKKNKCKTQPFIVQRKKYVKINQYLLENRDNLEFITLSETNIKLLEKHLGGNHKVKYNYFMTNELLDNPKTINNLKIKAKFDFVFHGSDINSKGYSYYIDLAKSMPDFSFFVPTSRDVKLNNVTCKNIRWETGLQEIISDSKIILTPSMWSNTPEASMLKSLKYNGCVALIKTEFGFAQEMPLDSFVNLSGDSFKDAELLTSLIKDEPQIELYKIRGKEYFQDYLEQANKSLLELFN